MALLAAALAATAAASPARAAAVTAPHGTWVGQLRIAGTRDDSPVLRTAVSGAVAAAELEPAGLPPAAILIVRRLADPLPGRLSSWRSRGADLAWERAGRAALQQLWERAARP